MFKHTFLYEQNKLLIKRHIFTFFLILLLLIAYSWEGMSDYKAALKNQKPFIEIEKAKISQYLNYTQYGTRGLRLLFSPSPLSVIFNELAVFKDLASNIDTGEGIYIYNSLKGKDLFAQSGGYMDFAGFMFLISTFLALIYGYNGTKNQEYLTFISDISNYTKAPFFITLVRGLLLSLVFVLLSFMSYLWLLINDINIGNVFFILYILNLILVIVFFVLFGASIGTLKRKSTRIITLSFVYCLFSFLLPWLTQKIFYIEASNNIKADYEFEYEKLKILMNLERQLTNRFGVWKSGNEASVEIKKMIENGQESEYKQIREFENERCNDMLKRIKAYQLVSSFFPTTYYLSVNKEISSKGFQSLNQFYQYALEIKYNFIKFYIQKKYYNSLPETGVESFIKGNENLFYGESQLPNYFWLGLVLNLFYIMIMLIRLYKIEVLHAVEI